MILTRTPLRLPLGGGSTDLPAYFEKYGGFIFSVAVNLYMYIGVNRPPADDLIRVKYRESEEVSSLKDLKHSLARAALARAGIDRMIEISSKADVSDGTGMGSSGSYLIGLLHALHTVKRERVSRAALAEEAYEIATKTLGLPDGKQDFYLASFGGFSVLKIAKNGRVAFSRAKISRKTEKDFERRTLLFYTGVRRSSSPILHELQTNVRENKQAAIELKHQTKRIGKEILTAFEAGRLEEFGRLLDEHWRVKRQMSVRMSTESFDKLYETAKRAGALGGKIVGAGGGGFFVVFCKDGKQEMVRKVFAKHGLREVAFSVAPFGTQILVNKPRSHAH